MSEQITNPIEQTKAMTDKVTYGFVNTSEVLAEFEKSGWTPVSTQFAKVRSPERNGFQKHLIRLENPNYPMIEGLSTANTSRPQLCVLNSHDSTSTLQILWGLIRIACLNGIISGTGLNGIRLVHSKNIVDKLPAGIEYMTSNFDNFANQIKTLQSKVLSAAAQKQLVETVYNARLAGVAKVKEVNYSLGRSLRAEDDAADAYTVFNRIQETLMRGGIHYTYEKDIVDVNGQVIGTSEVSTRTRRIASVTSQVRLNQLAYNTAIELAA